MDLNVSGIYKITSESQGKCYIGSSIHIRNRWATHRCQLKGNKHGNRYLQNVYNKHGMDDLTFEVIMTCEPEQLLVFEEQQIQAHNSFHEGLNMVETPTANMLGFKHSKETLAKMSKARLALGRVPSRSSKLTEAQVNQIRQKFFDGQRVSALAEEYGIHRKTIRECVYLTSYKDFPCKIEGYTEMLKTLAIARENGQRLRSRGWKQSPEHKEKLRKVNSGPNLKLRKLTNDQVREIRAMSAAGSTYREIAEIYPVNQMSISKIVRRITYGEVE